MSFLYWGALAVIGLAVAPLIAHLLRRQSMRSRPFAATHLVQTLQRQVRRRHRLHDRWLLVARLLIIVAIVLIGAVPLLHRDRLSIVRPRGTSLGMVLVIDDSLSMSATDHGSTTRFDIAKTRALSLIRDAMDEGHTDAVALVLAGAPARVELAPTLDLRHALTTVSQLEPSDRATDLDGALQMASSIAQSFVQPTRRVIVLSDLCDSDPATRGVELGVEQERGDNVWIVPMDLSPQAHDCAVIDAQQSDSRIVACVACTGHPAAGARSVAVTTNDRDTIVGTANLSDNLVKKGGIEQVTIDAQERAAQAQWARLQGDKDMIVRNDRAAVRHRAARTVVGVIASAAASRDPSGVQPVVEYGLRALLEDSARMVGTMDGDIVVRPLTSIDDTAPELEQLAMLVMDDPSPMGPETRETLERWLHQGGTALVAFGPASATSALGTSLDPLLVGPSTWNSQPVNGLSITVDKDQSELGSEATVGPVMTAQGRTIFATDALQGSSVLLRWQDGHPFVVAREVGRGKVYAVSVPFDPALSDLALRPSFLVLLHLSLEHVQRRGSSDVVRVGQPWLFESPDVRVQSDGKDYPVTPKGSGESWWKVTPPLAGRYELHFGQNTETRFAILDEGEINLQPRPVPSKLSRSELGTTRGKKDVSTWIVAALLMLLGAEWWIRVRSRRAR